MRKEQEVSLEKTLEETKKTYLQEDLDDLMDFEIEELENRVAFVMTECSGSASSCNCCIG